MARDDLGESIATSRNRATQHDSIPTGTLDTGCVAPRMALEPGPSEMERNGVVRDLRGVIVRGHSQPIFHGCSEGERQDRSTQFSSAMMLRDV